MLPIAQTLETLSKKFRDIFSFILIFMGKKESEGVDGRDTQSLGFGKIDI